MQGAIYVLFSNGSCTHKQERTDHRATNHVALLLTFIFTLVNGGKLDSITYLATKRINIDLMPYIDAKSVLHIGVRIRPWTQAGKRPLMVLSQGLTLQDAMDRAARDYHLDRWQELDWRRRPWDSAKEAYEVPTSEADYTFMDIGDPAESDDLSDPTNPENTQTGRPVPIRGKTTA